MPVGALTLEYGCTSIADPNRVSQYVANISSTTYNAALAPKKPSWSTLEVDCQCPALQYASSGPDVIPTPIPGYTTPALDFAPWYSSLYPESAQFYGFIIENVEDLSTAPVSRQVTDRATTYGGGSLGALRRKARQIKFTMLAFGNGSSALDYAFRWLTDTLTYSCSGDCGLCDATVRTSCPDKFSTSVPTFATWDTGRWILKNVGLVDGPRWEDPPTENNACDVRRVSFTLASESPYAYKCPVPCLTEGQLIPTLPACPPSAWICGEAPSVCCRTSNVGAIGEEGVVVTIHAREDLLNVSITLTPDTFGYVCGGITPPSGWVKPAACAQINIPFIPGGAVFRYDTSSQDITITFPGGETRDGTPYIDAGVDGGTPPTFPTLRCTSFCVCTTADRCSFRGGNSTVSVETVHRELGI